MERSVTDRLAGHEPAPPRCNRIADQPLEAIEPSPFRVVSIDGATLGQFDHLGEALAVFNREDAAAIAVGNYLVTGRMEGGAAL